MPTDTRVINLSRNTRLKPNQAQRRIAEGLAIWVDPGKTLRDATLKEVMEHRAQEARAEATRHLEPSEVHGVVFRYPESATWQANHAEAQKQYRGCLVDAREFANQG